MPFVVDASMTASWILPDERSQEAMSCYRRLILEGATVPAIWWFEVRNLVLMAERRNRIDAEYTDIALRLLGDYPVDMDHDPAPGMALHLARRHQLTIYDAAYLELSLRIGVPLATLDRRLAKAAAMEKVELIP